MLYKLSLKYQKEIALSLFSLFFISLLAPLKANNFGYDIDYGKISSVDNNYKFVKHNYFKETNTFPSSLKIDSANKPWKFVPLKLTNKNNHDSYAALSSPTKTMIGGPAQPEMATFQSVGTDNMVNLFTGDFTYNIPLLDVGGYPVNLFYNSGITMDQEASWVGLGWNINPGVINRSMRGIPDDFDGTDLITKTQSIRADETWGINTGLDVQLVGLPLDLGVNAGISFNNRLGPATEFGVSTSMNLSAKGGDKKTAGINIGAALNLSSRGGATLTPSVQLGATEKQGSVGASASIDYNSRAGLEDMHVAVSASSTKGKSRDIEGHHLSGVSGGVSGSFSFATPAVTPSITMPLTHESFSANVTLGLELFGLHPNLSLGGFYNKTFIDHGDQTKYCAAYGLMYLQNANNDDHALLDFNRIQDGAYTKSSTTIGMPAYTYDVFNISGEGTGGAFKAYRGDLGFVHDAEVNTYENSASLGIEIGTADGVHVGGNINYVYTPTAAGAWKNNNLAVQSFAFKNATGLNPSVYFKNPGEKAIPDTNYQNAIGGEDLVRVSLESGGFGQSTLMASLDKVNPNDNSTTAVIPIAQDLIKARDKRTQVINCLTANEATHVALDTVIYSYNPDPTKVVFGQCGSNSGMSYSNADITTINRLGGYRKPNHISEINVLQKDGKKYVYGIPVYNTQQVDVTMAIPQAANMDTCQVPYTSQDDSPDNTNGLDNYYQKEEMPPYAVSYLLTELVSPNYVDVTGDGITGDDLGDAVKFNYSKSNDDFKWRTPTNGASYSPGLKTENNDDKAHYLYGTREQWYLYSIESKNMVARFYTDARLDGRAVNGQSGGVANTGNQRLSKISLFSKGDLLKAQKTGIPAKPIKTVNFCYSYKLCSDPSGQSTNNGTAVGAGKNGKLTLDSIYFTYNGNVKQSKNKYVFHYPTDNNPNYNYTDNDRWGNYKPAYANDANPKDRTSALNTNPGGLTNADYPYTVQDKTKEDKYVAAWTMDSITIPSGGNIGITYESDDYAYVQNRRAASMTQILGFGYRTDSSTDAELNNKNLYGQPLDAAYGKNSIENNYIYIKLPVPILQKSPAGIQKELQDRYFTDVNQLYMKLAVDMPENGDGSPGGFEQIPVYADIDSYGLVSGTNDIAYVKVQTMSSGHTPMIQYALQFLRDQLPGEAYKGYNETKSGGFTAIFSSLAGSFSTILELTNGVDNNFILQNKCQQVETDRSFVRLSNPTATKLGGGLRVKKVVINDSWNKMTGQYNATYGQEYSYTTTGLINNVPTTISSGVAAWEPGIGSEENPYREIVTNLNRQKAGPYDYASVELPMGEMFYPGPSVGYSRVVVNSIHRDTVRNAPGTTVTEYYTTKDFPTKSSYTSLPSATQEFHPNAIMKILDFDLLERINLSQGFKVELNDMNGKEKSQATYSSLDTAHYISKTTNYYNTAQETDKTFSFNDRFNVMDGPDGTVDPNGIIGRDVELMSDFRQHQSYTYTANISTNLDFFMIGIFPVPLFNPLSPFYVDEHTYRSAAVTKIVNHYGVLDSTVVVDKGSMVSTKNLVYDAETGDVLLTRTNNEHDRPVYNFTYPAHWAYSGMGPAYKNIDVTIDNLTFRKGILDTYVDPAIFESGDEIYVTSTTSHGPLKLEPCDVFTCGDPYLVKNNAEKIWVVNTNKNPGSDPHFVFIDRSGQPYTADQVKIHIIRSGHRNMLDQTVGSITSMNSPINPTTGKLVFNDTTAILHTTSATFKDDWRVDDPLYRFDTTIKTVSTVSRVSFMDTAHQVLTITKNDLPNYVIDPLDTTEYSDDYSSETIGDNSDSVSSYIFTPNSYATHSSLRLGETPGGAYITRKAWIRFDKLDDFLNLNLDISCLANSPVTFYGTAHDNNFYSCNGSAYHSETGYGLDTIVHQGGGINGGWVSFRDDSTYMGNTSIVQLMRGAWYDYNDFEDWKKAFTDMDDHSDNVYALSGTTDSGTWTATGDAIGVKNLLQQLMIERNQGSNVAPALAFQMLQRSPNLGEQNIKCWVNNQTNCIYKKPAIEFSYFPCIAGVLDSVVNDNTGYCSTITLSPSICLSELAKKNMNPYVTGVLGNWRVDSTYAYYGSRKEKDPTVPVDLRVAGTIVDYKDFWNFGTPFLTRNYSAANVWVWNSTITQYNRKGYEIENKDPLGRYNSGLYGYNQQLPIAVTNNAAERETMFDGFEDYDYQTSNCASCKPRRHVSFGDIENNIVSEQQHTGQYSLKIAAGQTVGFTTAVVNKNSLDSNYSLRVKVDSNYVVDTIIVSKGIGLRGSYFNGVQRKDKHHSINYKCNLSLYSRNPNDQTDSTILSANVSPVFLDGVQPNHISNADPVPVPAGINADKFAASFDGYIQPLASGNYFFRGKADDGFKVTITVNGTNVILADEYYCNSWQQYSDPVSVQLLKGQFYKINISYANFAGSHVLDFEWKPSECTPFAPIPLNQLYSVSQITDPSNPNLIQSVTYDTTLCTQLDTVKATGRATTDTFSLLRGKKMLISAWAKEGTTDCKCSAYKNNTISVTFTNATDSYTLRPTGNIIEGWQRYEGVVNIPDSANSISVNLNNLSTTAPVYFDDIRMHPYNANMKSFVYNSSNLRLMAELDENNYASFYEYDDDGTLTRVKKETIRGIQTITETRSALQKAH